MEYKTYIGSVSLIQEICTQSATNYPPHQAVKPSGERARIDAQIASACHGFLRRTTPLTQRQSMAFPHECDCNRGCPSSKPKAASNCKSFQPSLTSALFANPMQCPWHRSTVAARSHHIAADCILGATLQGKPAGLSRFLGVPLCIPSRRGLEYRPVIASPISRPFHDCLFL